MKNLKKFRLSGCLFFALYTSLPVFSYALTWSNSPHLLTSQPTLFTDTYLADTGRSTPKGLVCYTTDSDVFVQTMTDLRSLNEDNWSEPILIASHPSIYAQPRIIRIGNEYETLITWIGENGHLLARSFNLQSSEIGTLQTLFSSSFIDDYAIDSNGNKWCCLVHTTSDEIHGLTGEKSTLSSREFLASGSSPDISMNLTNNAIGVFSVNAESSTLIRSASFRAHESAWDIRDVYTTAISNEAAKVAMAQNDAYIIAFRDLASPSSHASGITPTTTVFKALSYNSFLHPVAQETIVSRLDESVETFTLSSNGNGLTALSYRSLRANLPKYQLVTVLQNKNFHFGKFSEPSLVSDGEAAIGAHNSTTGNGRMILSGYCDSGNTALNTFSYIPGKGPHSKKSSRYQNFQRESTSAIDTMRLEAERTAGFAVWTHDGSLYGQSVSVPTGF